MRKLKLLYAVVGISVLSTFTSFASWVSSGTTWKYQATDGNYYNDGWHWIDGNGDSVAECYYFNADGNMLSDTTTPDNYVVDINGAWVINGVVQTKAVGDNTSSSGGGGGKLLDHYNPDETFVGGEAPEMEGEHKASQSSHGYGNASEYSDCIPGYTGPSMDEIQNDPNTTAGSGLGDGSVWY